MTQPSHRPSPSKSSTEPSFRKSLRKPKLWGLAAIVAVVALCVYAFYQQGPESLDRRVDNGFDELELPSTFVVTTTVRAEHTGDLITDAIVAEARTYRVSSSMEQARDEIRQALLRESDGEPGISDRRISMHVGSGSFDLEDRAPSCSPIQMPLKSNTFATVVFGETSDAVQVQLDEDGHVAGELTAETQPLDKYVRQSCATASSESFVTIVVWAM
jgi:hypothetical protein